MYDVTLKTVGSEGNKMLSKCFQQNFLVKKQIIFLQLEQVSRERHSELQSMSIIVACQTTRTNYTIYN